MQGRFQGQLLIHQINLKRTKLSGVYLRVPCVGSIITSFRVLRLRDVLEKGSLPSLEKFLQELVLNKAVRKGAGQLVVFDAMINDDFATGKERQILATDNIARPADNKVCKMLNKVIHTKSQSNIGLPTEFSFKAQKHKVQIFQGSYLKLSKYS